MSEGDEKKEEPAPAKKAEPKPTEARIAPLEPKHERLVIAGIALLFLVHLSYYFPRVVDDVFISVRYAENLARGHGAVYNLGEKVEGYSSPSWMFVQAFACLLHLEPVTFGKLVAVGCLFATAWGARQIAREMFGVVSWHSFVPAVLIAVNSYLVDWTVLGLETPLHIASLVLAPLMVHRALENPARKTRVWAAASLVVLGATRPESPLYVIICTLAPLAFRPRTRATVMEAARYVVPAGVLLALLLLLRRAYYHDWFPNTYHVKGAHEVFAFGKLADLWGHGSRPSEIAQMIGGSIALGYFGWKQKALTPVLIVLADLYFTASVQVDWMPSLRHLLPVLAFAPIGTACVLEEALRRQSMTVRASLLVICVNACWDVGRVDSRLSTLEVRDKWVQKKTLEKWRDSFLAYRRIEPPHVTKMNNYAMGQIAQCWPVLDTSKEPIAETWYAGRDIGALGYLTEVNVWDTAGLVTREVSMDPQFAQHFVSKELTEQMFAKRPVSADLYEGWDTAVSKRPATWLRYKVTNGEQRDPNQIVASDREAPSSEERLRRYRRLAEKMPHLFHLHTLYGEAVGAAVEKRLKVVENEEAHKSVPQ